VDDVAQVVVGELAPVAPRIGQADKIAEPIEGDLGTIAARVDHGRKPTPRVVFVVSRIAERRCVLNREAASVPGLSPLPAIGVSDDHRPALGIEFGRDRAAVGTRELQQVSAVVELVFGAMTVLVFDRDRAARFVVRIGRRAAQRVDLGNRQTTVIELDQPYVAQRIGDAPLVHRIEIGELVGIQPTIAPRPHDPPLIARPFVLVMERQTVAIGVPQHAMLLVGIAIGMAQRIARLHQVRVVVVVFCEQVRPVAARNLQPYALDQALGRALQLDAPTTRLMDRDQAAVQPFIAQAVAAEIVHPIQRILPFAISPVASQVLEEVIDEVFLGANTKLRSVIGKARTIHQLQHGGALTLGTFGKDGNAALGVVEGHDPALGIELKARVSRAFPADTTGSLPEIVRRVAAHPADGNRAGDLEVFLLDRHRAIDDVDGFRPQDGALQEAGIEMAKLGLAPLAEPLAQGLGELGFCQPAQAREGQLEGHAHQRDGGRAADEHVGRNRHVHHGGKKHQLLLVLLQSRRARHSGDLAGQHRHREEGERVAVGDHRRAPHEDLVRCVGDLRREWKARRDVDRFARRTGDSALHAADGDRRADVGQVVEDVEHDRHVRCRQRHRRGRGRHDAEVDVDPHLRVAMLGRRHHGVARSSPAAASDKASPSGQLSPSSRRACAKAC
jgi:hypothetical protein